MKLLQKLISVFILSVLIQATVSAQSFTADDGYVEFISRAPLLEFKGTSSHLTGLVDLNQNLVDFFVDLNALDTGIQRRNRDMRNTYLKTDLYPFAEFTGQLITPFDASISDKQDVRVSGTFNIHGVEREIEVEGTLESKNGSLRLEAGFAVLLEDHNIDRPRVLFYELSDEQIVNISILLRPAGPS
jgi:polyisoprenoid-binding protein YceI